MVTIHELRCWGYERNILQIHSTISNHAWPVFFIILCHLSTNFYALVWFSSRLSPYGSGWQKNRSAAVLSLLQKGTRIVLRTLAGAKALSPQSIWVLCPRWLNGILLACQMLGLSGHNMENLTTSHGGATCWEKCHIPRMLKNAAVVSDRSRKLCSVSEG